LCSDDEILNKIECGFRIMDDPQVVARMRTRILILRATYTDAVTNAEAAWKELRDVELPFPDGQQNYRNPLVAERAALEAYMDAVRELAALNRPKDARIP
jgi:hypothetical protein